MVAVVKSRPQLLCAQSRVDLTCGKIQFPFLPYSVPSGSISVTFLTFCSVRGPPSWASSLSDRLKRTHMGVNWTIVVNRLLFAFDQCSLGKLEAARYAAHWRGYQRIGEIAFRVAHANFAACRAARVMHVGSCVVIFSLADGLCGEQFA